MKKRVRCSGGPSLEVTSPLPASGSVDFADTMFRSFVTSVSLFPDEKTLGQIVSGRVRGHGFAG